MNISFCFVAFVLIISSVYLAIMRQDKQIFFDFQKLLNPEQIEKYHKIVRERFMIYVGGMLLGLLFGLIYYFKNKNEKYLFCKVIAII